MEISFASKSLQRSCNSEKELKRKWGNDRGKRIGQRLAELRAAESLDIMRLVPAANFHALDGDRAGMYAVDVTKNYRLIFKPDYENAPLKDDGGVDLKRVTEIKILAVEDYHGR